MLSSEWNQRVQVCGLMTHKKSVTMVISQSAWVCSFVLFQQSMVCS